MRRLLELDDVLLVGTAVLPYLGSRGADDLRIQRVGAASACGQHRLDFSRANSRHGAADGQMLHILYSGYSRQQ